MWEKASARILLQQDPGRENRYASCAAGIPILSEPSAARHGTPPSSNISGHPFFRDFNVVLSTHRAKTRSAV